ncbi:hypothetical protein C8J56DRAFT_1046498 [Mycena floridula]|nr:hypothetical protein C8J56DRAFT_1046498 [Mycena floridula]
MELPRGRFIVGPIEDLLRYPDLPPPPPFHSALVARITVPEMTNVAPHIQSLTPPTMMPATIVPVPNMRETNAPVEALSMDSSNRLNLEEAHLGNSSSKTSKGKDADIEMQDVGVKSEDVTMSEDGKILQIVPEEMEIDKEGFPIVSITPVIAVISAVWEKPLAATSRQRLPLDFRGALPP